MTQLPRLVIAAPGSGHGKTTVATGLMGALRASGLKVAGFKVGPGLYRPGLSHAGHRPAWDATSIPISAARSRWRRCCCTAHRRRSPPTSRSSKASWVCSTARSAASGFASTAHVAGLVEAPVILVHGHLPHLAYGGRHRARAQHLRPERPIERRDHQQGRIRTARPRNRRG